MASQKKPQFYRRTLPDTCTSFCSAEGKVVFKEALLSGHMDSYFPLAAQFRTQDEPAYCGLSTLVMVLNALEIDPGRVWKGPWRWYHENMLECCTPLSIVERQGITMEQFACLALCNTLNTTTVYVDQNSNIEDFRKTVERCSQSEEKFITVSYSRKILSQTGSGHFSTIGGYHKHRDLVLILDTARFKYPPHWVSLPLLFNAMKELDPITQRPRGYFVMSKAPTQPQMMFQLSPALGVTRVAQIADSTTRSLLDGIHIWRNWLNTPVTDDDTLNSAVMILTESLLKFQLLHCTAVCSGISEEHSCALRDIIEAIESHIAYKALSIVNDNVDYQCNQLEIGSGHLVTMILLSWPYDPSKSGTNGALLLSKAEVGDTNLSLINEVGGLRRVLQGILGYIDQCRENHCLSNASCQSSKGCRN